MKTLDAPYHTAKEAMLAGRAEAGRRTFAVFDLPGYGFGYAIGGDIDRILGGKWNAHQVSPILVHTYAGYSDTYRHEKE